MPESARPKTALPKRRTIEDVKKEESLAAETPQDAAAKELEEMRRIEQEERKAKGDFAPLPNRPSAPGDLAARRARPGLDEEENKAPYRDRFKKAPAKQPQRRGGDDKRGGRLTVAQALSEDFVDRGQRGKSLASQRRAREKSPSRSAWKRRSHTKNSA